MVRQITVFLAAAVLLLTLIAAVACGTRPVIPRPAKSIDYAACEVGEAANRANRMLAKAEREGITTEVPIPGLLARLLGTDKIVLKHWLGDPPEESK